MDDIVVSSAAAADDGFDLFPCCLRVVDESVKIRPGTVTVMKGDAVSDRWREHRSFGLHQDRHSLTVRRA